MAANDEHKDAPHDFPGPQALSGNLHVYDKENRLTYFESGLSHPNTSQTSSSSSISRNAVIFVGGLGDGLAAIPVLPHLSQALGNLQGWSLIQVVTRASYLGWVNGDVDRDVADLRSLETYLRKEAGKNGKLILLGHSTGMLGKVERSNIHTLTHMLRH